MFSEDDLLPISALQHLLFCERQCALIHIERQWAENRLTAEGRHLHRRTHAAGADCRGDIRIVRGLEIRSLRYGLIGKTDIVEFTPLDDAARAADRRRSGTDFLAVGRWSVRPVEYKRGRPKRDNSDRVQLCAQAMCLEEMLGLPIPAGAIFYGKHRRRTEVAFDASLRAAARSAIDRLHALIASGQTPPARREPKCDNCSLLSICLPDVLERAASMQAWIDRQFAQAASMTGPQSP